MANPFPLLCLALAAALPAAGAQEVYRWTDADGKVHFSDRPRDDAAARVQVDTLAPADGGAEHLARERKRQRLLEVFARERDQAAYREAYAAKQAETRATNCGIARDNLRSLREAPLVYDLDEAGERVYLSDDQRHRALNQARQEVATWCD